MAKYIIDIPDDMTYLNALGYEDGKCVSARSYIIPDLTPYVRSESYIDGLKEGQNDAWEFVRELIHCNNGKGMQDDELQSCFGYELYSQVFKHLSYQEAKAKYDAWKKRKDEIHVGDEVIWGDRKGVVVKLDGDGVNIVWSDGSTVYMDKDDILKTGEFFGWVGEFMEKIRGEIG